MKDLLLYALGGCLLAAAGFLCPIWYVGFIPLGLVALWAGYDLTEVEAPGANTPRPPEG